MKSLSFLEFSLFLLLPRVYSDEAVPVFKAQGSVVEMGYCFGVDYILVFRSGPEGDQLLGNSSAEEMAVTPPADLRGRIHISKNHQLLGLQIRHLTNMDSGIYRRECWQNQRITNQHTQKLFVCHEEVEFEEVITREEDEGAEFLCNSTFIGMEGTSVRWYYEKHPSYRVTLFLDSSMSLEPLVEEMRGVVEVRDSGALLLLDGSMLKMNPHFYCLVFKDMSCLSFQYMYIPDVTESRDMFASQGDRVVLNCPSDGNGQLWETPLGIINGSSMMNNQMHISFGDKSEEFSLVIPTVSDEHGGEYLCMSTSLEVQYSLILCPKTESQEKVVFLGDNILFDCGADTEDSQRVKWHRLDPSGEYELIHDSKDESVAIPHDLRGRLTLSENSSLLTISHLRERDLRMYLCIVQEGPKFMEESEYFEDYNGGYIGGEEHDTHRCIFKQETILHLINKIRYSESVTLKSPTRNLTTNVTADPSASSNVIAYAVGAGLVCLLLAGLIVAAIIIKRRARASHSRQKTTKDLEMNTDPDCTKRLTHDKDNHV